MNRSGNNRFYYRAPITIVEQIGQKFVALKAGVAEALSLKDGEFRFLVGGVGGNRDETVEITDAGAEVTTPVRR